MAEINANNPNTLRDEESTLSLSDLWTLVWDHKGWYVLSVIVFLII